MHPHALLAWSFHTLNLHLPACRPAEMYPVPPAKETQVSPQPPARGMEGLQGAHAVLGLLHWRCMLA